MISAAFPGLSQSHVQFTSKGKAAATIVITRDESSFLVAGELQKYVEKMSGVTLPISHVSANTTKFVVWIGKTWLPAQKREQLDADSMADAFIIYTHENHLYLAGKNPAGDRYAVYTLLEEYLGCMKFNGEEEFIPVQKNISVPPVDKLYSPAFPFRIPAFEGRWNESFAQWHKISNFSDWGRWWVHSFNRLVPPEEYFDEHPEYFALVDGRRLKDGQLCLGNPAVIDLLKENLAKEIALNPSATYWSVSQNDCYNYCECDLCQKMYADYGAYSGAYIHMANELARAFPDKQISTLAYQFTREAPKNIRPLPNVNIMFCSIECNRSMPLAEDPRSAGFVKDMKDWAALSDNLFIWDYVVQFSNFLTPFPNFEVLQPNIQFFRDHHGKQMFQQGSGRNWSDMSDLKQYLIAKLLWDPDINVDSVINRFMTTYYLDAAPFIQTCFDTVHACVQRDKATQGLDIYGFPVYYKNSFLAPRLLLFYEGQMDKAETAARNSGNPQLLAKVQRARLPYDFALIDIAINTHTDLLPWIVGEKVNPVMLDRLEKFIARSRNTGTEVISERNRRTDDYREFVLKRLERISAPNKLDQAIVTIQTLHSPKYPVGGEKALNDRLLGGLHFQFNWLGFEGEDMVVMVDLRKSDTMTKVSMNFLKAVESWVFLPVEISIEVSDDGIKWKQVASQSNISTDQNYLEISTPYNFKFDPVVARFVRITALNMKTCPDWHRGFGKPSWIFVDEIIIN